MAARAARRKTKPTRAKAKTRPKPKRVKGKVVPFVRPRQEPAGPPAEVLAAAEQQFVAPSEDRLNLIRDTARRMRDLSYEVAAAEAVLKARADALNKIRMEELVQLMHDSGVPAISIAPEGNFPGFELKLKPFYSAAIPEDSKEEAFAWLRANNHGDLIKSTVVAKFAMGDDKLARKLTTFMRKNKIDFDAKTQVLPQSLKAFVREQVEEQKTTPPLQLLGAHIGQVVEMKERD